MPSADNKYLQKRGNAWYIRIKNPPKCWGLPGEFIHTLRTPNIVEARKIRDLYLMPILAESKGLEMAERILKIIAGADDSIKERLQAFGEYLGDDSTELTILQLLEKFIKHKKKLKLKATSLGSLESTKNVLQKLLPYDKPVSEFKIRDVTDFRDSLLELPAQWMKIKGDVSKSKAAKMSPTTINNHLKRLSSAWKWGQKENHILKKLPNPFEGISAGTSKTSRTNKEITVEECDQLLNMPFPRATSFDKKTWKYFPIIARYTGMRLNEIGQLTTDDIRTVDDILCIDVNEDQGKKLKTDQSARLVPISDKLHDLIEPLIKQSQKSGSRINLFPKRGDYDGKIAKSFANRWDIKAKKIGGHIHFHGLRSYLITQLTNAGIEPIDRMKIVGHKDRSSHGGYTKTILSRLKKALDKVP